LWLNGNYQRALFHHVRKSSVTRLRELAEPRRRAALVCFLWQSYRDAIDQAVDMFDKHKLGDFLASRGQPGDAEKALGQYERSLKVREGLLRDNPQSGQAARDVIVSYYKLGLFEYTLGKEASAQTFLKRCFTLLDPPALGPKARGRHDHRPRPPARPQPPLTFWQRLFGHKETKPGKARQ
jgi:tetratricopeptide (TPR) repeat protein